MRVVSREKALASVQSLVRVKSDITRQARDDGILVKEERRREGKWQALY